MMSQCQFCWEDFLMMVGNQPEREIILDANQPIEFNTIKDAINAVIGTNYAGWMKACWPNVMGNGSFRLWFPKLAHYENGKPHAAAFGCVNVLSPDWNRLVFDDLKGSENSNTEHYDGYDLIFAKDSQKAGYVFRGVFCFKLVDCLEKCLIYGHIRRFAD